jgi:hypothetical protein
MIVANFAAKNLSEDTLFLWNVRPQDLWSSGLRSACTLKCCGKINKKLGQGEGNLPMNIDCRLMITEFSLEDCLYFALTEKVAWLSYESRKQREDMQLQLQVWRKYDYRKQG